MDRACCVNLGVDATGMLNRNVLCWTLPADPAQPA